MKAEPFAQFPLQVTYIILLAISRIVNEKRECRRAASGLRGVVEFQVAPRRGGRRANAIQNLVNGPVELRGRDRARVFLEDLGARRKDAGHAFPGLGGEVEARHEGEERGLLGKFLL